MKKILLSLIILAVVGLTAKVEAQCSVKDAAITIVSQNSVDATHCSVTFNLSFLLEFNGGNKIVVIQSWLDADYPNYWNCASTHVQTGNHGAPIASDLRKITSPYTAGSPGPLPFLDLAFNNDVTPPVPITTYGPDNSVPLASGYTITRGATDASGFELITLTGVTVVVPITCGTGATIHTDLWSSQGSISSKWEPHCVNCNNLYSFGYPTVTAQILCALDPVTGKRIYNTSVTNSNTTDPITFTWKAFYDDAPLGGSRGAEDIRLVDDASTPHILAAGGNYNESRLYSFSAGDANRPLWVVVTTQGLANTTNAFASLGAGCIGLPVKFKSFAAARNHSTVKATWVTSTEINNSGFALERLIGGSGWQQIAFVPSQAQGGNSNSDLTYTYNDLNNTNGISQYRVRQVDFDNKSSYSDIRAVRGEGQLGKTIVFPNPSNDGKVNVVFEDGNATRDISVMDMSGRMVKQMKGVTNNTIQIDNLTPGMYSLRVVVRETGDQVVEKVVINKR